MTTIRLPNIAREHYEAVRSLLNRNVPDTYDKWLDLFDKWRQTYAADTIIYVEVNPSQLADFLDRAGRANDLHALLAFVADVDS